MGLVLKRAAGVRRARSLVATCAALLLSSGLLACGSESEERRPDILLIVADTLRAVDVGFMGCTRCTTPRLDRLAASSTVFTTTISAGGNTSTAMAAIMTGRYAYTRFHQEWDEKQFGMNRFYVDATESGLPRMLPTLAERIAARGYTTAGVVTNPYLKGGFHFDRGFGAYDELQPDEGDAYARGDSVARKAIAFLQAEGRRRAAGDRRPFFLYLHFMDVHGPYEPPPALVRRLGQVPLSAPEYGAAWHRWEREIDLAPESPLRPLMLTYYAASVHFLDNQIAAVLAALDEQRLSGNTIVAFTADHGEEFLEHGGTTHKGTLYSEIVRVPLLIHLPRVSGRRVAEPVRNFDLMPTLLELAEDDPSGLDLDAVSLRGVLLHGAPPKVGRAYAEGFPTTHMVSTKRYRLIVREDGAAEFFDLRADPGERTNLLASAASMSGEQAAACRNLQAELASRSKRFEQSGKDVRSKRQLDEETTKQLRALGYLQ